MKEDENIILLIAMNRLDWMYLACGVVFGQVTVKTPSLSAAEMSSTLTPGCTREFAQATLAYNVSVFALLHRGIDGTGDRESVIVHVNREVLLHTMELNGT